MAKAHKSTPTMSLDIIYNILPIDLFLEKWAMSTYTKLRTQISSGWSGLGQSLCIYMSQETADAECEISTQGKTVIFWVFLLSPKMIKKCQKQRLS